MLILKAFNDFCWTENKHDRRIGVSLCFKVIQLDKHKIKSEKCADQCS